MRDFLVRCLLPVAMVLLGAVGAGTATHSKAQTFPPIGSHMSPECLRLAQDMWTVVFGGGGGNCYVDITSASVDIKPGEATGTPVWASIEWAGKQPCVLCVDLVDTTAPGEVSLYVNWGDGAGTRKVFDTFHRAGRVVPGSIIPTPLALSKDQIWAALKHTYPAAGTYTVTLTARIWHRNYCATICDYAQAGAAPYYYDQSTQITFKVGSPVPSVSFNPAPPEFVAVGQPVEVGLHSYGIDHHNVYIGWDETSPSSLLTPSGTFCTDCNWKPSNSPALRHTYDQLGTYRVWARAWACDISPFIGAPCTDRPGTLEGGFPQTTISKLVTVVPSPIVVTVNGRKTYGSTSYTMTHVDATPPAGVTLGGTLSCSTVDVNAIFLPDLVFPLPASTDYIPAGTFTFKKLTCTGITSSDEARYPVVYVDGTFTVDPRPITVTAKGASKTYGNVVAFAGTEFTVTGSFIGTATVTSVTLTSTGAAATGSVGPHPIVPSAATGVGLGNYAITYVDGTLTVGPRTLTITAKDRTKTYGELAFLGGNLGSEYTLTGMVNSDYVTNVTLASAGIGSAAAVGPYLLVISNALGSGLGNYAIGYVNGTLNVQPKDLTITASNRTKTYGETVMFAGTEFTPAGLVNNDSVTSVSLASAGAAATAPVANHDIVPSAAAGTGLGNYTIGYANGTLNVQPATLTITANNRTKTYGETVTFAGTEFTPAGLLNNDTVTGVSLASAGAAATAPVSSYDIVPGNAVGTGLGNYTIGYVNGTLGVQAKALTITANNRVKTYGDTAVFAGTEFTPAGLVNNDAVTSVALASAGADAAAWVGNYDIVPSAATGSGLGNYAIGYANGTLSVQPKTGLAGSTATGSGAASASFTGGGPTCTFDPLGTAFVAPTIEYAGSASAPHGMFKFRLIGCTVGATIRMSVTWPSMVGLQYMKYGPSAKVGGKRVFYVPDNLTVSGNTASFDVTDGALGDNDFEANGVIIDPTGPVVPPIEVPTLNAWMLALLGLLLAPTAAMGSRRFRRT